jgi:hypothetical protein
MARPQSESAATERFRDANVLGTGAARVRTAAGRLTPLR